MRPEALIRRSSARPLAGAAALLAATAAALLLLAGPLAAGGRAATPASQAATAPDKPVYDTLGRLTDAPLAPVPARSRLSNKEALDTVLAYPKVRDWVARYPKATLQTEAKWDTATDVWTVNAWSGKAGQIVTAKVDDTTGKVTEAWTGPQVAWTMGRGYVGSFGGDLVNDPWLWLGLSIAFLLGLGDLRRPLSVRNLDLLAMLSLLVSLWLFNEGDIFSSIPAAFASLGYLLVRLAWVGSGRRLQPRRPRRLPRPAGPTRAVIAAAAPSGALPARLRRGSLTLLLVAATVFALGLRIGLNAADSNVIDVGYAGVIGAHRIAHGQAPWGNFPVEDGRPACGPADSAGEIRDHVQTNGRCESSNPRGDTYGPTAYLAYLPGYGVEGWNAKWDTGRGWSQVPAAHLTSVIWDVIVLLGLALVGRRFGGARLAAALCFAWAAYPLTLYAYMSNTNDSIAPAILVFGFWLITSPWARGAAVAAAGWTKLGALVLAPLWAAYPHSVRGPGGVLRDPRSLARFAGGFVAATLLVFSVLLLEPDVLHEVRVFVERTFSWQLGRHSPFSLWDWGQYHAAGIPDLKIVQHLLQALLVIGAVGVAFFPRGRRSPRQLAALSGALLVGFQLVLTHWSWLYIPWFMPFAAIALLAPRSPGRADGEEEAERGLAAS